MPELIEVEQYRRLAAGVVGGRVDSVQVPDPQFVRGGVSARSLRGALTGQVVEGVERIGKLLVLDVGTHRLGMRFGMTGRLVLDGAAPVGDLEYGPDRLDPSWVRFALGVGGRRLEVNDARRLGGVELDPDASRLGVDATRVSAAQVRAVLAGSASAVKSRLMDQARIAGLGNLLTDEILWRAGIDPARAASSLSDVEATALARTIRTSVADLTRRGGSHLGDLQPHRLPGGQCPRDGAPLVRRSIGGRTSWSCPRHQR